MCLCCRQSKQFFDLERKASEELSVNAMKASADLEQTLVNADKHAQLCETYSSSDAVIQGLIDNKNIGRELLTYRRKLICMLLFLGF